MRAVSAMQPLQPLQAGAKALEELVAGKHNHRDGRLTAEMVKRSTQTGRWKDFETKGKTDWEKTDLRHVGPRFCSDGKIDTKTETEPETDREVGRQIDRRVDKETKADRSIGRLMRQIRRHLGVPVDLGIQYCVKSFAIFAGAFVHSQFFLPQLGHLHEVGEQLRKAKWWRKDSRR